MSESGSLWVRLKGKFVRPVSKAAGDRRSEAKAELQAEVGEKPAESQVDAVQDAVRARHHDIDGPSS